MKWKQSLRGIVPSPLSLMLVLMALLLQCHSTMYWKEHSTVDTPDIVVEDHSKPPAEITLAIDQSETLSTPDGAFPAEALIDSKLSDTFATF